MCNFERKAVRAITTVLAQNCYCVTDFAAISRSIEQAFDAAQRVVLDAQSVISLYSANIVPKAVTAGLRPSTRLTSVFAFVKAAPGLAASLASPRKRRARH